MDAEQFLFAKAARTEQALGDYLETWSGAPGRLVEAIRYSLFAGGKRVRPALALGADSVLLGRAWAYALAGAGEAGIDHMLALVEAEMRVAMALTGCNSIDDISRSILVDTAPGGWATAAD